MKCKSRKSKDTCSNRQVWHGVQNKAGQRLTELCQENTLVIANTLFQQHKRQLYTWTSQNAQYQNQIDYILCLLVTVKEEKEKVGLKENIQKTKIMASDLITSWQIDGETVEIVTDFILGDSKITANSDCSHEIKRRLLLGRKVTTKLASTLKSRDITLPTKVHLVKAMIFPVVMYGCELDYKES